jgi:hypothetical protein
VNQEKQSERERFRKRRRKQLHQGCIAHRTRAVVCRGTSDGSCSAAISIGPFPFWLDNKFELSSALAVCMARFSTRKELLTPRRRSQTRKLVTRTQATPFAVRIDFPCVHDSDRGCFVSLSQSSRQHKERYITSNWNLLYLLEKIWVSSIVYECSNASTDTHLCPRAIDLLAHLALATKIRQPRPVRKA